MAGPGAATVAQVGALVAIVGGIYLLLGLAWTLIIGGALVLGASVVVELLTARASGRAPARNGDRAPARTRGR